jgi:Cof subfamily protein (haloacid dehalogenase superfamily)
MRSGNVETVKLFCALGGRFTIASGRTPESIAHYIDPFEDILTPCIASGGSVIYNFNEDKLLKSALLPWVIAKKAMADIMSMYPQVGVMISGANLVSYQFVASAQLQKLLDDEHITYLIRPQEATVKEWNKVLFAGSADMLAEIAEFVAEQNYPGIYFVSSDPYYLEMMPEGVSKGSALRELCEQMQVSLANTIVIGDYYNDIEMMKTAGYSVAMNNAPKEVQVIADEVTGDCNDSGVGQFLYKLINKYGQ